VIYIWPWEWQRDQAGLATDRRVQSSSTEQKRERKRVVMKSSYIVVDLKVNAPTGSIEQ
jgi:hypothetical protein